MPYLWHASSAPLTFLWKVWLRACPAVVAAPTTVAAWQGLTTVTSSAASLPPTQCGSSTPARPSCSCSLSTLAPSCLWGLPPAPPLLSSARVDVKAFRSLGGRTLASSWSTSQGGLGQGVGLLEQRQHKLPERGPQQPSSPSHQDILGWQTIHSNY